MKTRLVLVRHGETVWHAENRYAGRTDIALTERGLQQAERLAAWAKQAELASVWSSTLSRARVTAEPSAAATGHVLQSDERLVELDFGLGEGLTNAEMEEKFPQERAAFLMDPVGHHLPGGEDPRAAAERGIAALHAIAAMYPGQRSLVVAHNTLIRLVLCQLMGIPLSHYRTVFPKLANGTLTEIQLTSQHAALLSFNSPLL